MYTGVGVRYEEVSGLIGLVISLLLLFGFDLLFKASLGNRGLRGSPCRII